MEVPKLSLNQVSKERVIQKQGLVEVPSFHHLPNLGREYLARVLLDPTIPHLRLKNVNDSSQAIYLPMITFDIHPPIKMVFPERESSLRIAYIRQSLMSARIMLEYIITGRLYLPGQMRVDEFKDLVSLIEEWSIPIAVKVYLYLVLKEHLSEKIWELPLDPWVYEQFKESIENEPIWPPPKINRMTAL